MPKDQYATDDLGFGLETDKNVRNWTKCLKPDV
nr:MAG TPA: hypothetical protein [Caudoviricetes sp.]